MRDKIETSEDLRDIERRVDSLAMSPADEWGEDVEEDTKAGETPSSIPAPVRSVVVILELLPPRMRIVGLALILAGAGALIAWKGGAF